MKVVALAGGTGSAKLLRGLSRISIDLTVVANVGDNFWVYGVYVCPDVDVATYTLAGIADPVRGWGIAGDTFKALSQLSQLGKETWFKLGDRDMASCLARTEMLRKGATLTFATERISRALGVKAQVIPATDEPVETRIDTTIGNLHLQEFWVREMGTPRVLGIRYGGAKRARPTYQVASAIANADRILVCPANPVSSIGPMLAIPGFTHLLSKADARIVALSPMEGDAPFSGPAGKLMKAIRSRPDSLGVAKLYSTFLDCILISETDSAMRGRIMALGTDCGVTDTRMDDPADELRLAKVLLEA